MAKGFDHSAPCGTITSGACPTGAIRLSVNGAVRQQSTLSQMIWAVPEIVAELSRYVTLRQGDLIYTGTPEKVGKLVPGDTVLAQIDGLEDLAFTIG
jgi:fumarylpyruvate hydrolase